MTDNAVCPFCGQSFMMPSPATANEAEEYALNRCDCLQAREYRRKVQYIAEAKDKLREIFNYQLVGKEESADWDSDSALLDILNAAIEQLADFKIRQIVMSIPAIGKIVITVDANGKIKIKRLMTYSLIREV